MISLLLLASLAQVDDAGVSDLERELDAAADAGVAVAVASPPSPLVRVFQSLNPDLSVIVDATAGVASEPSWGVSADDPDLRGGSDEQPAGFTLQEVELALSAAVDPYLKGEVYLTVPNLRGVEVEEAVLTSTSLPGGLQVKAGLFRSAVGRQNAQHLHLQDFTRRPMLNEAYLGVDGLRAPGVQVAWLLPTPFFSQLAVEAFSIAAPEELGHLATFGGGQRADLSFAGTLEAFGAFTPSVSLLGGLSFAGGKTPGLDGGAYALAQTLLQGADLHLRYKPPNVTDGYFSLQWTTEYFVRQLFNGPELIVDGGLYTQLVVQVARRWVIALREDVLGVPSSEVQPRVSRTSLSLTFTASEFARLRLHGEREVLPEAQGPFFLGREVWAAYLQLEASIGAHGAHPF